MPMQVYDAKPSFGEQISQGLSKGLQMGSEFVNQRAKKQQEQEAFKKFDIDPSIANLPEKFQQEVIKKSLQNQDNEKIQSQLNDFADKLEINNPNMKSISDIYRMPGISLQDKSKIIESITGTDPYKQQQMRRLQFDSDYKIYSGKLKELKEDLKALNYPMGRDKDEYERIKNQIKTITAKRDDLLEFYRQEGTINYSDITSLNEKDEDLEETYKVKFDKSNPDHMAKYNQLKKKFNGDKEKINTAMSREFTL